MTDISQLRKDFWDFSLAVYRKHGVFEACHYVQDKLGGNVNLLLFTLWCSYNGMRLDPIFFKEPPGSYLAWNADITSPLRDIRRKVKGRVAAWEAAPKADFASFYEELKSLELQAEYIEQGLLLSGFQEHDFEPSHLDVGTAQGLALLCSKNLLAYLYALDCPLDINALENFALLILDCFPEIPPLEAIQLLLKAQDRFEPNT